MCSPRVETPIPQGVALRGARTPSQGDEKSTGAHRMVPTTYTHRRLVYVWVSVDVFEDRTRAERNSRLLVLVNFDGERVLLRVEKSRRAGGRHQTATSRRKKRRRDASTHRKVRSLHPRTQEETAPGV